MKEIEVKAKLRDKKAVIKKLEVLGCKFKPPVTQDDTVYALSVEKLEDFFSGQAFLRLRVKNDGKVLFTAKKRLKDNLVALEHETEVASRREMEQALLMMGYKEAVRIKKERQTAKYNGCEICIDEVEGLGSFIEIEKLSESDDTEKIQNELFTFFVSLGILPEDRVTVGYDILIFKKREGIA